jgi:hypothetical protein
MDGSVDAQIVQHYNQEAARDVVFPGNQQSPPSADQAGTFE